MIVICCSFFWRFQNRWPLPEAHGTGNGQGPVPLTERCWWRMPNVQIAVLRPQIGATSTMSNTILTLFPNLISVVSHDRLPHSEKWEWRLGGCLGGGWFKKRKDMGALCFFKRERDRRDKEWIFLPRETAHAQHPDLIYKLLLMANKCCGCVFANKKKRTVRLPS